MKQNDQTIPFEDICIFLKKTYDRPGRLEHALLDYLTLGKGIVRDLITTWTNKLGILSRLGAEALPKDRDRALILRALSAPWILGGPTVHSGMAIVWRRNRELAATKRQWKCSVRGSHGSS